MVHKRLARLVKADSSEAKKFELLCGKLLDMAQNGIQCSETPTVIAAALADEVAIWKYILALCGSKLVGEDENILEFLAAIRKSSAASKVLTKHLQMRATTGRSLSATSGHVM